jgi:hypothetical protein
VAIATLADWDGDYGPYLVIAAALYLVGSLGVTMAFNVPRNEALARAEAASADAASLWQRYLVEWTAWNTVRTVASLAATRRTDRWACGGVIDMELAVTSYELSLFIHITAAVAGLGATFVEGITYATAVRLDPRHLAYKHSLQLAINKYLALPALVVLLATGLYQADEAGFELGRFWLVGAMSIVALLAVMIVAYFIPEDRRLQAIAERDIAASGSGEAALSAEYRRRVRIEALPEPSPICSSSRPVPHGDEAGAMTFLRNENDAREGTPADVIVAGFLQGIGGDERDP